MWAGTWHDEGVDDRALIKATLAGDRQAFGIFVERETRGVYQACLRILGRPHDAEDVTQETFVAAYRAIGGFRGDGSLPPRVSECSDVREPPCAETFCDVRGSISMNAASRGSQSTAIGATCEPQCLHPGSRTCR